MHCRSIFTGERAHTLGPTPREADYPAKLRFPWWICISIMWFYISQIGDLYVYFTYIKTFYNWHLCIIEYGFGSDKYLLDWTRDMDRVFGRLLKQLDIWFSPSSTLSSGTCLSWWLIRWTFPQSISLFTFFLTCSRTSYMAKMYNNFKNDCSMNTCCGFGLWGEASHEWLILNLF